MQDAKREIVLYHIAQTRSERVLWLLEELGAPYRLVRLSYRARDQCKPEFLKINPIGAVPALTDGDLHIRESGAIIEYLLSRFPERGLGRGPADADYVDYLTWLHSVEGTLFRPAVRVIMHTEVLPEHERIPRLAVDSRLEWLRYLAVIDAAVSARPFVLGERFSAADIMLGHALHMAAAADLLPDAFTHARAYLTRLSMRPAFKTATGEA